MTILIMPEASEVRHLTDQLEKILIGRSIKKVQMISSFNGKSRYEKLPTSIIENFRDLLPLKFLRFTTKGKYILIDLAKVNEKIASAHMIIHLYMTGKVTQDYHKLHSHYKFEMDDDIEKFNTFYYSDYRRFGYVKFITDLDEFQSIVTAIAPPLVFGDTPLTLKGFLSRMNVLAKSRSKHSFLMARIMDQKTICSGIGNYLIAESFYRAKIYPWVTINQLEEQDLRNLFQELENCINEAYQDHGMSLRDYADANDKKGTYQDKLKCYGRKIDDDGNVVVKMVNKKDKRTNKVKKITPHGRTLHWVPSVQTIGNESVI